MPPEGLAKTVTGPDFGELRIFVAAVVNVRKRPSSESARLEQSLFGKLMPSTVPQEKVWVVRSYTHTFTFVPPPRESV